MLIDWDMCVWCENVEEMERIGQPIVSLCGSLFTRIALQFVQGTWPFISAQLLMARDPRPHLLRDDLESFVHVLFYHVLRYRPMYPEGSDERLVLIDNLNEVFDGARWRVPNGRVVGGKAKAGFLTGTLYFDSGELREHIRPIPLLGLLEDVRDAFEPLYTNEPPLFMYQPEDEGYAEVVEKLEDHRRSRAAALEQLQSSKHMLSLFRYWTKESARDDYEWLPDDGAHDVYTPRPEPSPRAESRSSRKRSVAARDAPNPVSKVPRLESSRALSAGAVARARTSSDP